MSLQVTVLSLWAVPAMGVSLFLVYIFTFPFKRRGYVRFQARTEV